MGHEKIPTDSEKLFPLRDLNRVLLPLEADALATRPPSFAFRETRIWMTRLEMVIKALWTD
jgi:hypothetical protein